MNKKLDDYFTTARNMKAGNNPWQGEDLLTLLDGKKPVYIKYKGGLFIMTSLLVALIGLAFLAGSPDAENIATNIPACSQNLTSALPAESEENGAKNSVSAHNTDNRQEKKNNNDNTKDKTNIVTYHMVAKDESIIAENIFITVPGPDLTISRPFQSDKTPTIKTYSFGFGKTDKKQDLIEPATLRTEVKGSSVIGSALLQLSRDELQTIGILLNDSLLEYDTESFDWIHPVPFRNNPSYRYGGNIPDLADNGYQANGDTFLVKYQNTIDLNYKFNPEIDTLDDLEVRALKDTIVTEIIDGKPVTLERMVGIYANNKKLIGLTEEQIAKLCAQSNYGYRKQTLHYNGWPKNSYSRMTPVCVAFNYRNSDKKVRQINCQHPFWMNEKPTFTLDYTELLPVAVEFNGSELISKIVFWFFPTKEFIGNLPERYRAPLEIETEALGKIRDGIMAPAEACSAVRDSSFLDICRLGSGAISIEGIFPNPVETMATFSYRLSEARKIRIDLHDIMGGYIGNLMEERTMPAGTHKLSFNARGINPGLYLISVKSDKNEITTIRTIIK